MARSDITINRPDVHSNYTLSIIRKEIYLYRHFKETIPFHSTFLHTIINYLTRKRLQIKINQTIFLRHLLLLRQMSSAELDNYGKQ